MASPSRPALKWCAEHDCPLLVWDDGSMSCWHALVVESDSHDHEAVPTAAEAERDRLRDGLAKIASASWTANLPNGSRLDYLQDLARVLLTPDVNGDIMDQVDGGMGQW